MKIYNYFEIRLAYISYNNLAIYMWSLAKNTLSNSNKKVR